MPNIFCSNCGAKTNNIIPEGDDKIRAVCSSCGTVHYDNPKMVVGCIVEKEDRILLCRRSIQPQKGRWTLPAGYLENNETAAEGALRETFEESGADVELCGPYRLFDLPSISQLYFLFRARLLSCPFLPTSESSEVELFRPDDIPWEEIAFQVITLTLRHYREDVTTGSFPFAYHVVTL